MICSVLKAFVSSKLKFNYKSLPLDTQHTSKEGGTQPQVCRGSGFPGSGLFDAQAHSLLSLHSHVIQRHTQVISSEGEITWLG